MAVSPIVQLYVCALDGLSYDSKDGITAHMKLQHGIERLADKPGRGHRRVPRQQDRT